MRMLAAFALLALTILASAADEAKKDPNLGVVLDPTALEVWTTASGSKYHTKDCPSAKVETTLAKALVDGDTACAKCSPPVYDPAKIAVFTGGEGGKKYHLFSCRFAKDQTTLAKAAADGLTPCSACKPPVLWTPPSDKDAKPAPAPVPTPKP